MISTYIIFWNLPLFFLSMVCFPGKSMCTWKEHVLCSHWPLVLLSMSIWSICLTGTNTLYWVYVLLILSVIERLLRISMTVYYFPLEFCQIFLHIRYIPNLRLFYLPVSWFFHDKTFSLVIPFILKSFWY